MSQALYDTIILGSGPAGLTAAIYTSRAHLKTLTIAGNPPGGQLTTTTDVENFPGFPEGIQGPELISQMRAQAQRFGTEFIDQNALKIQGCAHKNFCVETEDGTSYLGKTVIIATGASARWLNIPSEQNLRGKGVSACATCDAFFFKEKVVAVVGGGDSAMEESIFLTKFATKVYVLVRGTRDAMRASKIMRKRAEENQKIEFMYRTNVKQVLGESSVTGLIVTNADTNEDTTLDLQGLFIAIGHTPNTKFLSDFITLDKGGYAHAENNTIASVDGVFIAGDVYDRHYRQAITAAGFGCMAALDAEKYLAEHSDSDRINSGSEELSKRHWSTPANEA